MTTNVAATTTAPAAPATPATPPAPGTPEYAAAMAAVYDNQVPKTDAQVAAELAAAAQAQPPQEQAAKTPESAPAEKPVESPKADEAPKDEAKPLPFAETFADPDVFARELAAEGKFSDGTREGLKKLGVPDSLVEIIERGVAAELTAQETALHEAAGGKESFDALVSWGQKNLSEAERNYFDQQLNSPFRKEAVALLKQRAGAALDPRLFTASGTGQNGPVGFESQAQMVAAMRDPRYQIDPAYRAEVTRRLAVSDF